MTQSYPINSGLTITVHSDGTVTWSSESTIDAAEVCRQITIECGKAATRIDELGDARRAVETAPKLPSVAELRRVLDAAYPCHHELKFTQMAGIIYVELAHHCPPKESSPYIATIASALETTGYTCTRSRTRVTVRSQGLPEREPDFVCTRTKR